MVEAIRLKIFQQMPNYKKPASVVLKESFPLPPYSTIIGMIHNACKYMEYHPMKISIQGRHSSDIAEIEKQYAFGNIPKERCDIIFPNSGNGVRSGMKTIQFLTDIELCIHIVPENQEDIDHIFKSLCNPEEYLSIGRREDIARFDEISKIMLEKISEDDLDEDNFNIYGYYDMYCPLKYLNKHSSTAHSGTAYKIPKVFGYENKKRVWKEVVNTVYLSTGCINQSEALLMHDNVYLDRYNKDNARDGYVVILA